MTCNTIPLNSQDQLKCAHTFLFCKDNCMSGQVSPYAWRKANLKTTIQATNWIWIKFVFVRWSVCVLVLTCLLAFISMGTIISHEMLKEEQAGFSGFFFFCSSDASTTALVSDLAWKAEPSHNLQDRVQQACHLKEESEPYMLCWWQQMEQQV